MQRLIEMLRAICELSLMIYIYHLPEQISLTSSMPAFPNCCCSKCSEPCWSNPPFLIFWHSGALASMAKSKSLNRIGTERIKNSFLLYALQLFNLLLQFTQFIRYLLPHLCFIILLFCISVVAFIMSILTASLWILLFTYPVATFCDCHT